MVERRRIVNMWKRGGAVALATLVRVEGSSYRREGARILIHADGTYVGSVSGGCLEAEIVRKAPWLVRDGATVQRYSTLFDDTAEIPYGLGCGGTVEVLLEPVETPECQALLQAMEASLQGESCHIRTVLPGVNRTLQREVVHAGAICFCSQHFDAFSAQEGFTEELVPPQTLFLFGAGDDAQPMVRMAALLGWRIYVFDGRAQWARSNRFPEAQGVFAGMELTSLKPGPNDAVILMTHSYEQDRSWLQQVLPQSPRYIGLLGSRHRSALLVSEAAKALQWPMERACERLFSPVGLDLGGDGAEAVALSAIAEVQACVQGKLGHSRRMTPETVAEQVARGGPSLYLQTQCAV